MKAPVNRGLLSLVVISLVVLAGWAGDSGTHAWAQGASRQATASVAAPEGPAAASQATLRGLIDAGKLPELRWPDFADYRAEVKQFYEAAGYALAWVRDGQPTAQAGAVAEVLEQADGEGLEADGYDGPRWAGRLATLRQASPEPSATDLAGFDLALTVCVMRYISDLHLGRVNPKTFHFGFDIEHKQYDLSQFLRERLVSAEPQHVKTILDGVEPPFDAYRRAREALESYEQIAKRDDGEPLPVPRKTVGPGDTYDGIPRLAPLLRLLGDLPAEAPVTTDPPVYREPLVAAVKNFQRRHGLDVDGRLGARTLKQLNVPLSQRAEQLRLTLERWRWVPAQFAHPPIIVNIPEFILRCWNAQNHNELQMRVVVGKAFHHKTPVFAAMMRYLIFRPYWNVPPNIQQAEMVPKIRKDADYFADNNFEVVTPGGELVSEGVVSAEILAQLRSGALAIRQKPGPKNALGLVKFIFPNEYDVYLHSTPATELFAKSRRDFSHGCIRVQDPVALAAWVLRDKPGWDKDHIIAVMNGSDDSVQVDLRQPIPVLIVYSTAAVRPNGEVQFFDDIYGYDAELEQALAKADADRK